MAGRSRNNNMYQRPEAIDPGFVDVEPLKLFSPEVAGMDAQNLGQSQQRYDQSQTAIAKYIEDIGATPMSEQDKKFAYGKLQKDLDNIHEQVKTKGGDYSNYLPEIVKSLSKARGTLHLAKQRYEEEQKLAPILSKLQAEGKLLWENGVDPRTQSVFDTEGKYKGGLNYDFREQSNYDDIVNKGVVQGIDKLVREGGLQGSRYEGLLQQIQTQGLSALDEGKGVDKNTRDNFVKELAKEFKNEFERTSTWGIDGKMKTTYGDKSENYIESAINRLAKDVQTRKYMQNPGYDSKKENNEPEASYVPLATFTGQGLVDEISQKAVKEAEEVKTILGKAEAARKKINIIKENNLPVFEEIPTPEWENPVTPEFPEQEARWKAGKASYADAANLGAKRMAQAASYVAGLVERSANWVTNTEKEGRQKIDLEINVYSTFGLIHGGKYITPSPETMDEDKMSKYLELLWDEKDKYNLIKENGLIKIDDTKPSGTRRGSEAEVNRRYIKAAHNVSKILNEGLDNIGKNAKEAYNKIQEYRTKNPIIDILAGRFAEESKNDPFTMYNKAIDQMINTKKDQELVFSTTTSLYKLDTKGDNIVKDNIKIRIIQMNPEGVGLKYNTDNGLQTIDTKTAGEINKAVVENKLLSTQLDINNFNVLLSTDAGTNYKVDIMPLLPNYAKPVVQGIREFIKKGTELDFFRRDAQGNLDKDEGDQPIYEEPTLELLGMAFKYELNSTGKTVKPILKGSVDNGKIWIKTDGTFLTKYVSEYLNTVLSQTKF